MTEQGTIVGWRRRNDRRSLWRILSANRFTREGDWDGKYEPTGEKSSGGEGDQGQRNVVKGKRNSSVELYNKGGGRWKRRSREGV